MNAYILIINPIIRSLFVFSWEIVCGIGKKL